MKISGPGSIAPAALRRMPRSAEGADDGFAAHLPSEEGQTTAIGGVSRIAPTHNLLALQEVPDATQSRRRAVKRGSDLLDRLDEIRHGLLLGTISPDRLIMLARNLREQRSKVDDPQLIVVLDEIELRAAVELAKLGH